ncbi:glutathione S-transferase family protein [Reticulomyxa filosa]|uniref:Glutathione S-transferase family protein n=1 Tax=Reticulomyxa filosa TaxID=46433 RepID=X6M776_RETFI|nr:glutathione S-transferase family protein [Reticulomyxa filosa]|eukprot:ETO09476.1 glutathione S-transferase family protein [Reticulomyxa filosa]
METLKSWYGIAVTYVNSSRKNQILFGVVILPATLLILTRALLRSRAPAYNKLRGGLHEEITLPRKLKSMDIELYHNCISTCSVKVRLCLAEKRIPYVSNHIHLIETGWYESCSPEFSLINPGKVVPVLVFKGHPVYESDDIIEFIETKLDSYAQKKIALLSPGDKDKEARAVEIMNRWLQQGSTKHEEHRPTPAEEIAVLSVPIFTAMMQYIPLRHVFYGFIYHFEMKRPFYFMMMKLLGTRFFTNPGFLKKFYHARERMSLALKELNDNLKETGGDYICGKSFTLADVTWMPLLWRLEETGQEKLYQQYEYVDKYWKACKQRDSFDVAITQVNQSFPIVAQASALLKQWRAQYPHIDDMLNP